MDDRGDDLREGNPPFGVEVSGAEGIESYCRRARRSLISKKYQMLEEVAAYADKNGIVGHERRVLRGFCEHFSRRIHEVIRQVEAIEDLDLQHAILIEISILTTFSNSLGNLGKMNHFLEQRKKADSDAKAAHARAARPDLSGRNEDILCRARRLWIKKPSLQKSVNAMAVAIEAELADSEAPLKKDAIRKVLSANLEKWKVE